MEEFNCCLTCEANRKFHNFDIHIPHTEKLKSRLKKKHSAICEMYKNELFLKCINQNQRMA